VVRQCFGSLSRVRFSLHRVRRSKNVRFGMLVLCCFLSFKRVDCRGLQKGKVSGSHCTELCVTPRP